MTIASVDIQEELGPDRLYPKGKHCFAFTLVIPSSTAPSERSEHGSIEHKIVALAEGDGLKSPDVEASVPVCLAVNLAP